MPSKEGGRLLIPSSDRSNERNKNSSSSCRATFTTLLHCFLIYPPEFFFFFRKYTPFFSFFFPNSLQNMKRILLMKNHSNICRIKWWELMRFNVQSRMYYYGAAVLWGCRCSLLNATGPPLLLVILGFHILTLSTRSNWVLFCFCLSGWPNACGVLVLTE